MCDRFPRRFDVQTSYKPPNYVLGLKFVLNIKFPRATYHMIVPSTKELYCLNILSHTQLGITEQKLVISKIVGNVFHHFTAKGIYVENWLTKSDTSLTLSAKAKNRQENKFIGTPFTILSN